MEAVMQKWEGLGTDDKEVIFRQQRAHLHSNTTNIGIEGSATFSTNEVSIEVDAGIHLEHGENEKNNNLSQNAKNKNLLPAPEPPIFESSTSSSSYVTTQSAPVGIVIQNKDEEQEFYLKKIFIMPPSHGFYCPSCKVCIEKVLVCKRQEEIESPKVGSQENGHQEIDDRIRCLACFSFLIRRGSQLFQGWGSGVEVPSTVIPLPPERHDIVPKVLNLGPHHVMQSRQNGRGSRCDRARQQLRPPLATLGRIIRDATMTATLPRQKFKTLIVPKPPVALPADQPTGIIPEQQVVIRPGSNKAWEILKSIVYGGLTEILASLSVVTSAASAGSTTLNVVVLAIANLIGGLFILVHNLRKLKAEKPRAEGEDNQTDAPVDRYSELLGDKDNFILHVFVAILSFLVFGLVPPVVYGFSFYESDDKDFQLAAVAGASLLCITLLAIAKAYIQSTNSYLTYFKIVLYYVSTGALASILTYVAGTLMKRLMENLGWFEPRSNFDLFLPEMSLKKPRWGSY